MDSVGVGTELETFSQLSKGGVKLWFKLDCGRKEGRKERRKKGRKEGRKEVHCRKVTATDFLLCQTNN